MSSSPSSSRSLAPDVEMLNGHVASQAAAAPPPPKAGPSRSNGVPRRHAVHLEVRLAPHSSMRFDAVSRSVHAYLDSHIDKLECDAELPHWRERGSTAGLLAEHVDKIWVAESATGQRIVPLSESRIHVHVYQPASLDVVEEFSAADPDAVGEGGDDVMAASLQELPSQSLEGVWDSLIYADDVKTRLLNYIYTTLLFSDAKVDFNVVAWNRVVLLHGPPGTGKTTLCKALAQKLAIRLSDRYTHGKLVEINSHSLFSKWFSESGKLVQRLFSMVTEMVEDEEGFVVILIDEVESLTAARSSSMSGSEPSDALRVVNALLTQLDKLKHRKNVLVMTTSNISEAIDNAFIDRADIKAYVGLPPPQAIYWILASCFRELMRVGLVEKVELLDWKDAAALKAERGAAKGNGNAAAGTQKETSSQARGSLQLWELAGLCQGMSGRTLRRLPVLAHARYIGDASADDLESWLEALRRAALDSRGELEKTAAGGSAGKGVALGSSSSTTGSA